MVLGMISENMRIINVKTVENIPTRAFPYTSITRDPTIEAPTVFAIVLRHKIAEIGLSVFCLSLLSLSAPLIPWSSSPVIKDRGVESRVASSIEHNAERAMERSIIIYISCSAISVISLYS